MTIRDTILAFLDCGVNATADQIVGAVQTRTDRYIKPAEILTEIEALQRDRWLIHSFDHSVSRYRRRTATQHAQLMAELDGTQPKLL
jgi:hypothetical protein